MSCSVRFYLFAAKNQLIPVPSGAGNVITLIGNADHIGNQNARSMARRFPNVPVTVCDFAANIPGTSDNWYP